MNTAKQTADRIAAALIAASPEAPYGWTAKAWQAPGKDWARVYVQANSRSARKLGRIYVAADGTAPEGYVGKMQKDIKRALRRAITLDTPTADIVDHLTAAGVDWQGGPVPEPGDQSRADSAHAACVVGSLSLWPDEAQGCWMWRDGGSWGSLDSYDELDRLVGEAHRA